MAIARPASALLLAFTLAACGGPAFLVPLQGDPKEAQELLAEEGYTRDDRPASVRTTELFFTALAEEDAELCWYLLDLRAAAAWQAALTPPGAPGPTPADIVTHFRRTWPGSPPDHVERVAHDPTADMARVRVRWTRTQRQAELDLTHSSVGWRLVVLPPGAQLAAVARDPSPTDVAPPIERNLDDEPTTAPQRPSRPPFGGGGIGY